MCIRGAVILFTAMKGRAEIVSMRNYLDTLEFAQSLDGAPSDGEPAISPARIIFLAASSSPTHCRTMICVAGALITQAGNRY
jgi:hypothetical protein